MTRIPASSLVFLLLSGYALADTSVFVNVNVVPMNREVVLADQTVVVVDGRIESVTAAGEASIPPGAKRIDGGGRYLMPGLAEMHAHVPPAGDDSLQDVLDLYLVNGVTLARGMLGEPGHLELRRQLEDGELLGPRLYTSGPSFNGNSITSPASARDMVRAQKEAGYDFLKVHPGLSREEFDAMATTANEVGIPFAGHVPADVGVQRALEMGIATIDHLDGYLQALLPEAERSASAGFFGLAIAADADAGRIPAIVAATQDAGTWNVPTEALFVHWVSGLDTDELRGWPEMRYMPAATIDNWSAARERTTGEDGYSVELADRAIALRGQLIKALHDAGAGLLLGSDAPQVFNVPGFSLHRELQYIVAAGLSPYEALRTGTVNPARFFGREGDWGTVEPGRAADLVLLDGNPLEDVTATQRIAGVMMRGHWLSGDDIRDRLAAIERQ